MCEITSSSRAEGDATPGASDAEHGGDATIGAIARQNTNSAACRLRQPVSSGYRFEGTRFPERLKSLSEHAENHPGAGTLKTTPRPTLPSTALHTSNPAGRSSSEGVPKGGSQPNLCGQTGSYRSGCEECAPFCSVQSLRAQRIITAPGQERRVGNFRLEILTLAHCLISFW